MTKFITFVVVLVLSVTFIAFSQPYKLSGNVTDEYTGEVLIGANVFIKSLNLGAVSDMNGKYEITNIPKGTYEVTISFVGYLPQSVNYQFIADIVHNFSLVESPVLLQEAVVQSTRATLRETPVAFSEVKGEEIQTKIGSRDLPQVLNVTPSLYSSAQGGGSGDANLVVRGFNQRNIAIMINGVPVNDMENGWVYWSNWAGLGSVSKDIQIQRGLGASPYSVSAIGGVVNIQTFGAAGRQEFSQLSQEVGSNGFTRTAFSFSSMLTDKIGMTALVAKRTTDGYAEGLWLDEYTYFLSVGGVFGKHSLELTGVGSPQEHGQRTSQQTINRWNSYGLTHNFNYGYLFDEPLNERVNKYHKPQWNLNWNWQINPQSVLATIAYFSWGNGYGSGPLGAYFATTPSGYTDFDAAWAGNQFVDTTYSTTMKRSTRILRNSVNNHFWTGLLSTYTSNLTNEVKLTAGIDARYYLGEHYREVRDLLGGDYYLDTKDVNDPINLAQTGNKVDYYNDGKVILYGGFAQIEYKKDKYSVFLNLSGSNTQYQRIDYFNFEDNDPGQTTDWQRFWGYTAKGGVNYNIDNHNNIFVNAGYFSKAPIFDNVFDFANNVFDDIENETILGLELGYGFATPVLAFNINGFYTNWSNRAISVGYTYTDSLGNETDYQANIAGAEQGHIGVEFEGKWQPLRNLSFGGMFSWSENKFKNDVESRLYPEEDPSQVTEVNSYVDGLYVSDFPMTTASLYMNYQYELSSGSTLIFNPVYSLFSRYYAVFNPDSRTDENDETQSWRMPDYYIFNVYTAYKILLTNFFVKQFTFGFNVYNVMNTKNYITDATDGSTHDASTARVWYGQERNYTASFIFNF
jgi:iron complex outermembrane receptor protein